MPFSSLKTLSGLHVTTASSGGAYSKRISYKQDPVPWILMQRLLNVESGETLFKILLHALSIPDDSYCMASLLFDISFRSTLLSLSMQCFEKISLH